jgi:hypothetical protein
MKITLLAGAALIGAGAFSVPARASIIVTLENETKVTGGSDYTYQVTLSQDEQLNTAIQANFFDVYDFGLAKLVSETGDLSTGNWTFINTYLNTPQYAEGENPVNNPSIASLRFVYNGPVVTGPSLGTASGNLGTFTVFTTYTGSFSIHDNAQDAQLVKYAPGQVSNNTPTSNLAAVAIPNAPAVPEPASLALLATGVLGMCAFGYRRGPKSMKSKIG